ncbi:tetratricopeptide repeat protein [Streptomyces sp. NPDC046881]|uniref:tetratricopeptide repeat protein n=1 Tax=Streptomyces sp. NPDC046881 TaxID=3155374 RepID=UPI0034057EBB
MEQRTPGNPFAGLLPPQDVRAPGRKPTGRLGDHLLVYEVLRGGMGEVHLCGQQDDDGPTLALKTFQRRFFFDREPRDAFVREVVLWTRLTGLAHIMPALFLRIVEGRPFVAMPLVREGPRGGRTVRDLLAGGRALPAVEVLRLAFEVAAGMNLAQRKIPGLVHGDLKPENLLLLGRWLLVSDFGLSRVAGRDGPSDLESTWAYRAPECWEPGSEPSVAADVYAFGTVLFELLAGGTPYAAAGREEWRAAHRSGTPRSVPPPPAGSGSAVLVDHLSALARDCLAPSPEHRPEDFGVVLHRLLTAAEAHEPMSSLGLLHDSASLGSVLTEQQAGFDEQRIESLFGIGEYGLVLEEIDSLPPASVTPALRYRRGSVLSLLGRDEEALVSFRQALDSGLPARTAVQCRAEVALSLKRLGNLEQAGQQLRDLAVEAPPDMRPGVLINLATVHLTAGRPQRARELMTRVTAEHSDQWQAWGNLGLAFEQLGAWTQAVDAYQHALGIAPQETFLLLRLAVVCMDRLHDVGTAWQALEMAHGQGLTSEEWYVRYLACHLLLGRTEEPLALDAAAREQLGASTAEALWNRAVDLADRIAEPTGPDAGTDAGTDAGSDAGAEQAPGSGSDPAPAPQRPGDLPPVVLTGGPEYASPGVPFLNLRIDARTRLYTVDFYFRTDSARDDYAGAFADALEQDRTRLRLENPQLELRATPFYFTRCPGCGGAVLTNRDPGRELRCRWCGTTAATRQVREEGLDGLRSAAEEAAGLNRVDLCGLVLSLLVDPHGRERVPHVLSIATTAGWEPLPEDHVLSLFLRAEADRRGMVAVGSGPVVVLRRTAPPHSDAYADTTPPDVERLLVALRAEVGPVMSLSHVHDPVGGDPVTLALQGERDDAVGYWQRLATEEPLDPLVQLGLAESLISAERLEEALPPARRAVGLLPADAGCWATLGRVHRRRGEAAEAAEAFERSLALDPVQPVVLFMLADCYSALDRPQDAAVAAARAAALGRRL